MTLYYDRDGNLCEIEQVIGERALIYAKPGQTIDVSKSWYVVRINGQLPDVIETLDGYVEVV